jgi:hypothetical protein
MRGESELWRRAEATRDRIRAGEVKATASQVDRLNELIRGREAWADADAKVKQAMIGLIYERECYFGKLWFLEQLCSTNNWAHPLLGEIGTILYEESEEFKVVSRVPAPNTV